MEDTIQQIIKGAEGIGALSATAVWALFSIYFIWRDSEKEKQSKSTSSEWLKIRSEEARADIVMSQAVQKMAEEISAIKIILSERLPGKGG